MAGASEHVQERAAWQFSEFKAMNTTVEAMWFDVRTDADVRAWIIDEFGRMERKFSRFLPDSELSRLNRQAGNLCMATPEMADLLVLAEHYGKETDGIFTVTALRGLLAAGYTDSFERLSGTVRVAQISASAYADNPDALWVDSAMKAVRLAPDVQLDLGGIAKSWTVARLSEQLKRRGISRGMINAGGDLAVWGGYAAGTPWVVDIQNPWSENENSGSVALYDGAVATSGILGRRWMTDRGEMHHLIDSRTMLPSRSDVVQCTVIGQDPVECEVWSKTLCILGSEEGRVLYGKRKPACDALLFRAGGDLDRLENERGRCCEWLHLDDVK